jgi:predicted RNA-binding protein
LSKVKTIERNGEYWRIIDVLKPTAEAETDSDTIDLDVIRVYLDGPQP